MSDEKTYTQRDLVLAQQEAFEKGAWWQHHDWKHECVTYSAGNVAEAAKLRFSLPKVTRARVVADPHGDVYGAFEWTVRDERCVQRTISGTGEWFEAYRSYPGRFNPTRERVALWADLLANPTEEVEAE